MAFQGVKVDARKHYKRVLNVSEFVLDQILSFAFYVMYSVSQKH